MAFTHDTKPNMKNSTPTIRIEITVSRLLSELASTVAEGLLKELGAMGSRLPANGFFAER